MKPLIAGVLAVFAALAFHLFQPTQQPWRVLTDAAEFPERDTSWPFQFDGDMWLSNGYINAKTDPLRDLWRSSDGVKWTRVLEQTPYDKYSTIGVLNGTLYAVKTTVWKSSDGVNWEKISDSGPTDNPDALGMIVTFKGRLWWYHSGTVFSSRDAVNWRREADPPYSQRHTYKVLATDDAMYVFGGSANGTASPPEKSYPNRTGLNSVWRSHDGANWTQATKNAPWSPRMWPGGVTHKNKLYVFGGFDNANSKNLGEMWVSETRADWRQISAPNEPSPRHWPSLFSRGDEIVLAAGNGWPVRNDVFAIPLP